MSSAARVLTFILPAIWLSQQPWVELEHFWYVSVVSVALQAIVSWWLLRGKFRRGLAFAPA